MSKKVKNGENSMSMREYLMEEKRKGKKLSKIGEWLISDEGREGFARIVDMRAVLK